MTSGGNNFSYFPENQLTKFMYFPGRGCVRTLRNLYVYATEVKVFQYNATLCQIRTLYLYVLLMYKLKGLMLSVTIASLLDFNNTGLGGQTVCGPALLNFKPGPFSFINIQAWPEPSPRAAQPTQGCISCLL